MSKTILRYRTFDQLLDAAAEDLHTFNLEGMIEPAQLIKVALKINKELGLKIYQTKETIIDINHRKGKLPDDFYVANAGMLCGKYTITEPVMSGRHTENVDIESGEIVPSGITEVTYECPYGDCQQYKVIEKLRYETRTYTEFFPLTIKAGPMVSPECMNIRHLGRHVAELSGQHIRCNFDTGRIYLSYEGNLEDEEGNLLVLDHDIINEYYEYAFKLRILENLYLNGEDLQRKIDFIEERRYKPARTNALSIVNTPDFAELEATWKMNRTAMHRKYYNIML